MCVNIVQDGDEEQGEGEEPGTDLGSMIQCTLKRKKGIKIGIKGSRVQLQHTGILR